MDHLSVLMPAVTENWLELFPLESRDVLHRLFILKFHITKIGLQKELKHKSIFFAINNDSLKFDC